jgi:uncharacterized protein (DUF983 family)
MVTVEEYKPVAAAARRRGWYYLAPMLFVLVGGIYGVPVGLMLLIRPFRDDCLEACAQWVVRNGIGPGLTLLLAVLLGLAIGFLQALPVIGAWRLLMRFQRQDRRLQDRRLFCPHCDRRLSNLAPITGNCHHCDRRALDVADDGTAAVSGESQGFGHQLLTVEEFNAAVRNRRMGRDPKHRDPRLRCPRCQADLMGRHCLIVATRKCPHCEAPVLQDPDNTPPVSGPHPEQRRLSIAVFRANREVYGRVGMFGAMLILCLGWVPAFLVAFWEAPLKRHLGETGADVLVSAVLILGGCLALRVGWLAYRRLRRKLHLDCPHCGQSLLEKGPLAIATHRCSHCGRRALAEEGEPAPRVTAANEP